MKRVAFLLLLFASAAGAQTTIMNIRMRDGGTTSIPLRDIRKLTFSPSTDVQRREWTAVVATFTLLQNYPNPFNPATTIRYDLPKGGNVEVKVFDISGRLVRTLADGPQPPGAQRVVWDGRDNAGRVVATGPYLYRVHFDNATLMNKMIFLK